MPETLTLADTLADETDPESMRRLAGRLAGEVVRISATVDDLLELSNQPARLGDALAHDTDLTRHDKAFGLFT